MNTFSCISSLLILVLAQLQHCSAFAPLRTRALMKPVSAFDMNSIIVTAMEVVEKADDYQYGAVAAPSWALPLGAVLVIFTAAIPVLLKPGEEVCLTILINNLIIDIQRTITEKYCDHLIGHCRTTISPCRRVWMSGWF